MKTIFIVKKCTDFDNRLGRPIIYPYLLRRNKNIL